MFVKKRNINCEEYVVETASGMVFYRGDSIHRTDGPACLHADGSVSWWQFNEKHRDDGPAVITKNQEVHWYWRGSPMPFESWANVAKDNGTIDDEQYVYLKLHHGQ